MPNCVTSTLAPYSPAAGEWTAAQVGHLYRSLGYGADHATIQAGLNLSPSDLVNQLVEAGENAPIPEPYSWSEWTSADYDNAGNDDLYFDHYEEIRRDWLRRGMEHPFQQKMSIFWHDHFSTEQDVYNCNRYAWRYYLLLHQQAFGNFRDFVEQMGTNPAMLVYLDGNENVVGEPNENYARELMELFTMGEGNGYTQTDIEEVAKALTGWRIEMYQCTLPYYDPALHDNSVKTIFGQTGNFGYEDVHELIFSLRAQQTATYICTKLYQHFIYREVNEDIVAGLAQTFIDSNWEIAPVVRQLLSSEHFFEQVFHGSKIKSPVNLLLEICTSAGLTPDVDLAESTFDFMNYATRMMGQQLFDPPNVAGWPGSRFWLSENALALRWSYCHDLLNNYITDPGNERLQLFALAVSPSDSDPNIITAALIAHLLGLELDEELVEVATLYLKAGFPENYFTEGIWNLYFNEAPEQIINLFKHLVQLPEYQLA